MGIGSFFGRAEGIYVLEIEIMFLCCLGETRGL